MTIRAKCMRCGSIDPDYEFVPGQIAYVIFCETCGASAMHEPIEINTFVYPPHYEEITEWIRTRAKATKEQMYITHTILQTEFNLTYGRSKKIIEALARDRVIISVSSPAGKYEVLK